MKIRASITISKRVWKRFGEKIDKLKDLDVLEESVGRSTLLEAWVKDFIEGKRPC